MVQVIFEVTWVCPARCRFCTVPKTMEYMRVEDFERVLRLFRDYFKGEDLEAVISGGEPSVLPDLKRYVEVARGMGFTVTVVSNGFNPERVVEASPDAVEVSLDYIRGRHDASRGVPGLFDNCLRLIELAGERGITVVVRSTAVRDNIDDILELRRLLDEKGFKDTLILVMPVRGSPGLKPSRGQLERLEKTSGVVLSDTCPAGVQSFVVTPRGEVLACIFYRRVLARLKEYSLREIEEAVREGARIPRFPCEQS